MAEVQGRLAFIRGEVREDRKTAFTLRVPATRVLDQTSSGQGIVSTRELNFHFPFTLEYVQSYLP